MLFESKKETKEKITFQAKDLTFATEVIDGKMHKVGIRGNNMNGEGIVDIDTNEESIREFHKILGQVLDHIYGQDKVGG
jgi:hypothetical protein